MRNEILQYSALESESVEELIRYLSWMESDQIYSVRMYCPGGDVQATWGVIAKMNALRANGCISIAKVDGMAMSMAGVWLCFFDQREALEVSNIMLHRATFGTNEDGTPYKASKDENIQLAKINNDIKIRLNQVIDSNKLKAIKGYTIDDLFDATKERVNCYLTAFEAQQIGLITKVVPVDANNSKAMATAVMACYNPTQKITATAATADNLNTIQMTKEEYKQKFPEAFKAIEIEAVNVFKASENSKGTFAKCEKCNPKPEATNDDARIEAIIEARLKAYGLATAEVGTNQQTAVAQATETAKIAAENAAKTSKEEQVSQDLQKEIEAIKSGKTIS